MNSKELTKKTTKAKESFTECMNNCVEKYEEEMDSEIDRIEEELESYYRRYPEGKKLLWYPGRTILPEIEDRVLYTSREYPQEYPSGLLIHWTAGRGRSPENAGPRFGRTPNKSAIRGIKYADKDKGPAYLLMDRMGRVFQNFAFNRRGYHSGRSGYEGIKGSVHNELVGIEIQCAGKLKEVTDEDIKSWEDYNKKKLPKGKWCKAWFTRPHRGDFFFSEDEVRYSPVDKDNCFKGYYHKYTEAQEESLTKLILWLHRNNPEVFKIKYVLGHDTVAKPKGRKVDPGFSMSRTIPEYQEYLESLLVKK